MAGLSFVSRVGFAPERSSPATPQMTTLGGGVRLALLNIGYATASTLLQIEGVYFAAGAYNQAVAADADWRVEQESYSTGWRGSIRLSPAVDVWPTGIMGFRFTPAARWLVPVGEGGPAGNELYVSVDLGVVFTLRRY